LLPSIGARRDLHQAPECPTEAAGVRKTEAHGDVGDPLIGLHKQMAGRIEANFRDQSAIARAHFGNTTLQGTPA
jgi:hypothetical protein